MKNGNYTGLEIAVIGMAGRIPGVEEFNDLWNKLAEGKELISFFSDEELLEEGGVDKKLLNNPNYVKAFSIINNKQYFDSQFFEYSPVEAKNMDPQIRLFHECVYEALEDAGYSPFNNEKKIGLFAGAGPAVFWEIQSLISYADGIDGFSASFLRDRTFMSSRIAYKLNLKGPAVFLHTACSTSLVAICKACDSILLGESEIAIAGGITLSNNTKTGYMYSEGMILSPDGHCRTFDAEANGTVGGEGAGVVVLKRLRNAIADRDNILALIKGYSTNNDGANKVGYTAPSVKGQAETIVMAQKMAKAEPRSITYIEAHGTGTKLGDPIEIQALTQAFGNSKEKYCAIGSVKSNVGHLDTAAGVLGFIKTVLSLKYRQLLPSLHYNKSNPNIDFDNSPFYVNTNLKTWNSKYPLRAGVSSFGIGGTNAHVILEEAPEIERSSVSRNQQLIVFSAKTLTALEKMTENLKRFFQENQLTNLANVAYTLQTGRASFSHKKMFVCKDTQQAIDILSVPKSVDIHYSVGEKVSVVVFMFSGQGSQYVNMGRELYESERYFRNEMDNCFRLASKFSNLNFKDILYISNDNPDASVKINNTENTQPLLFILEYSLAHLLMKWGIKPNYLIGHSIGEYVAACISGLFSLNDALKLVIKRGELIQGVAPGSMLSISITEEDVMQFLNDEISLAAVNSNNHCVVSGNNESISILEHELKKRGYEFRKLHTSHAFHSSMMEPILEMFRREFSSISFNKPEIPFVSNVTGKQANISEISSADYWINHLRNTVCFSKGAEVLLNNKNVLFLEIGPGNTLSTFIRQHKLKTPNHKIVNLIKHPLEQKADLAYLLNGLGEIWLNGIDPDWNCFYEEEQRCKVSMPTYPFDKIQYPYKINFDELQQKVIPTTSSNKRNDISEWFYKNKWEQKEIEEEYNPDILKNFTWLIFSDNLGFSDEFICKFKDNSAKVIVVKQDSSFQRVNNNDYLLNPFNGEDEYFSLFKKLKESQLLPDYILHFWEVTDFNNQSLINNLENDTDLGLFSLINIAKSIGKNSITKNIKIFTFVNDLQKVTGLESINPNKSTLLGATKIISIEYANIQCANIDIELNNYTDNYRASLVEIIFREFFADLNNIIIAYRGFTRFVKNIHPVKFKNNVNLSSKFKNKGIYLIIGGFGGMGFTCVNHLATIYKAKIVLLTHSEFPDRRNWQEWLSTHGEKNDVSVRIHKILELEKEGAEIVITIADVDDYKMMQTVINDIKKRFVTINGVIHAAGVIDYGGIIQRRTKEITWKYLTAKVKGTLNLYYLLKSEKLDFLLLISSVGNDIFLGKYGQVSYNAANEFLESFSDFVSNQNNRYVTTVNMCDWNDVGMSVKAHEYKKTKFTDGISQGEGMMLIDRALMSNFSKVTIYPLNLKLEIDNAFKTLEKYKSRKIEITFEETAYENKGDRPQLTTEYVEPKNKLEQELAEIYQDFLGIKKIGIHDDFYEIGGDSLKAISLIAKIQKKTNKEIPLIEFLNNSTINKLSNFLTTTTNAKFYVLKQVQPFYFGRSNNLLFGIIHNSKTKDIKKYGIVFCYPIGQEYIRSHRAFLLLANELSNSGVPSLRFDYSGYGDSNGACAEISLNTLLANIHTAVNELKQRTKVNKIVLVGARFGGTLCYLYSMKNPVDGIVLWNSIFDGKKYIEATETNYKKWLTGSFAKHKKNNAFFEAFGFPYSKQFISEIKNVNLFQDDFVLDSNILILDREENDGMKKFKSRLNVNGLIISFQQSNVNDFWVKHDENIENFFEPEQDINSIFKWIENLDISFTQ